MNKMIDNKKYTSFRFLAYVGILIMTAVISFGVQSYKKDSPMKFINEKSLPSLFPSTNAAIIKQADDAIAYLKKDIDTIINIKAHDRTFENTAQALDKAITEFSEKAAALEVLFYLSPDEQIRKTANEQTVKMGQAAIDIVSQNKLLYEAFKAYMETTMHEETLTPEQDYFLQETMRDFKQAGLELPEEKRQQVIKLEKELAQLSADFEKNINETKNCITVHEDELTGLDQDFIQSLPRNEKGLCIVGVDYPTYHTIMKNATNVSVRKRLYHEFHNRAYPENYDLLAQIIKKRDEKAKLLGYPSYAYLSMDNTMAHDPAVAQQFLADLLKRATIKASNEFKTLIKELPESVVLTTDKKMQPWDFAFVENEFKKKKFDIDEEKLADYFPADFTVNALFDIYQKFFDLTFIEKPVKGLWHPDVRLIEVQKKDNTILGYIILDLYPRPGKYSHAAKLSIIHGQTLDDGKIKPAVALIMANFPAAKGNKPSLFKRSDVEIFFHEFGHAIHALLGATTLGTQSGTHVKIDFVEMPSQMLEEWLYDKEILKKVSKHYQTGQPLPDDIINTLIAQKQFMSGNYIMTQGKYAQLSLECYKAGSDKDIQEIHKNLSLRLTPHVAFDDHNHMPASFGHLTGYGPNYYGYLWSKVFALDLFNMIKQQGLLNPEIGTKYATTILQPGGSKDPNELLIAFLGRAPNQKAFLEDLGL